MFYPTLEIIVSVAKAEKRTYTDRTTNQTREYTATVLSGVTQDFSTMVNLRLPENLAPSLMGVKQGERLVVELDSYDARRGGVAEGTVRALAPAKK